MKKIIILRHAKSSWDNPLQQDKERSLNDRGRRDAPRMAEKLMEIIPIIDCAMVSSSQRTRETITLFRKIYQENMGTVTFHDNLYHGMPDDYQSCLFELDNNIETLLMVGHNPGITILANHMITEKYIDNVPTCGIIIAETGIPSWQEFTWGQCTLRHFLYPKLYV